MGSKLSKALRPHVKAAAVAASPAAFAQHHHECDKANEIGNARQDLAPQLPENFGHDDIDVATSTTTMTAPSQRRRNSAPARPTAIVTDTSPTMENQQDRAAPFELLLASHRLISIDDTAPNPLPPTVTFPPPPPAPVPRAPPVLGKVEVEVQCLICCNQLPAENDPRHARDVIKPCKSCSSAYCTSCVKKMFIEACKDVTHMPPRCCVQIHLHHARPYLSKEEVAIFKSKYEEWSTPNPFYCPVPTCSTFIPERMLPQQVKTKGKQRVDSGIETPTSNSFACPACVADICADCRQVAHPNSMCNVGEFGIDAETAALLKSWGYKKCPKCGHGLKRMFGCNHMECRCGAHFCWSCMRGPRVCDGVCYDDEEEEYDSDAEPDEADEAIAQPGAPDNTDLAVGGCLSQAVVDDQAATQAAPINVPETTTPPQPIARPRNLDGGSHRYWEGQDLFFGAEPTNDIQDRSWNCKHNFSTYKISLAKALVNDLSTEMECVKCWCSIRPEIESPKSPQNRNEKIVPASVGVRVGGMGRGRIRGRGRGRGRYIPPRGLFRADATIGTAPHLTTTISPLSQSAPTREMSPMEDVQYTERVVDTYGNIIVATELDTPRRASIDNSLDSLVHGGEGSSKKPANNSNFIFQGSFDIVSAMSSKFSFAHECRWCGLLVCETCRDATMGVQEAKATAQGMN